MSLRDEFPSQNHSVVTPIKYAEQAQLDADIERFLKKGGAINEIPAGYSGDPEATRFIRNEFDPEKPSEYQNRHQRALRGARAMQKNPTPIEYIESKNRQKKRSKYGQGISCSGNYFTFTIASIRYGCGEKWDQETCTIMRDKTRAKLGLPKAEY
jgi:hypothetical protein